MPTHKPPHSVRFYVRCKNPKCDRDIVLDEAPPGAEKEPQLTHASVHVECGHCGFAAVYTASDMQLAQVDRPKSPGS